VENSGEVAALLRQRYPAAKVQTVSFDRRPDITVTDQVWFGGWVGRHLGMLWQLRSWSASLRMAPVFEAAGKMQGGLRLHMAPQSQSSCCFPGPPPRCSEWMHQLTGMARRLQPTNSSRTPLPAQVKLMSDTSILVTPCGGLATVLTFLRPGATAIAMNFWHSVQQRSLQLEDNYYSRLEYLDIQYMPVTPEDYAATRYGTTLASAAARS